MEDLDSISEACLVRQLWRSPALTVDGLSLPLRFYRGKHRNLFGWL